MARRKPPKGETARLERGLHGLRLSLLALGPVAQGTILRRAIRRDDPAARPGETKCYGPYYQWTRKIAGRTAIQNLTATQARAYGQAIRENRRLERTIAEMRAVSLKLLELTTPGVARRRGKQGAQAPLS